MRAVSRDADDRGRDAGLHERGFDLGDGRAFGLQIERERSDVGDVVLEPGHAGARIGVHEDENPMSSNSSANSTASAASVK